MTPYQERLTPTVKRMAEEMRVRNFAQSTIDAYTLHVDKFEMFFNKSVTELGQEEIHQYQLHLVDVKKVSRESEGHSTFDQVGFQTVQKYSVPVRSLHQFQTRERLQML